MMRWTAIVLAAVLVLAAGMGNAQAPSAPVKLALVIGNADYDGGGIDVTPGGLAQSTAGGYVPDLRNPINDASDVHDALTRIGFKVDLVTNADGPTMSAALATFGTKVAEAPDTAQVVIYYAGHAMQVDGVNYLIPARARLPQVDFSRMPSRQGYSVIESVTVPIQRVVDQFREPRAPGVNLLILDACRDNPWDGRVRGLTRNTAPQAAGLAQVAAPTRTIVSFSTALNRKAQDGGENDRNSPFAAALKDAIGEPGTIAEMLDGVGTAVEAATFGRQSPWYQSASVGQVCLANCRGVSEQEKAYLQLVLETMQADYASRYLSLFPQGAGAETVRDLMSPQAPRTYKLSEVVPFVRAPRSEEERRSSRYDRGYVPTIRAGLRPMFELQMLVAPPTQNVALPEGRFDRERSFSFTYQRIGTTPDEDREVQEMLCSTSAARVLILSSERERFVQREAMNRSFARGWAIANLLSKYVPADRIFMVAQGGTPPEPGRSPEFSRVTVQVFCGQ